MKNQTSTTDKNTNDALLKAESWWNKLHPSDNIKLCEKYKWRNIFISNEKLIEIYRAEHIV